MLRFALASCFLYVTLSVAQQSDTDKDKPPPAKADNVGLKVGRDLPGPFHPFNVTGAHKGKYHCVVSQHGLHPGVLILVRDANAEEPFKHLLAKLDALIEKKPGATLGGFVVFVPADLEEVVKADDAREQAAAKVEDAVKLEPALKHVVAALAGSKDLGKYKLRDNTQVAVILFRKYRIEKLHELDKLTAETVDKIMTDVEQMIAPRK